MKHLMMHHYGTREADLRRMSLREIYDALSDVPDVNPHVSRQDDKPPPPNPIGPNNPPPASPLTAAQQRQYDRYGTVGK